MTLISFTRGLINNVGVKLIALVVALMIWFNASGQQEVKRNYIATLRFVNLPDTLTLVGRVPLEAELSVSGTRRDLLFMGFRKLNVMVNMARAHAGRFSQRLSVADVILPPNVEPGDVRILSPSSVDVAIERLATKRVRVGVILFGSIPAEQMLEGVPRSRPLTVLVTGPKSAVDPLETIPTEPIDLARIHETTERKVALEYDADRLVCEPNEVTVDILISARGRRVLANVPPTILIDDENHLTEIFPKTVSLTIEGPQSMLDTLTSGDVSVLVDLSGRPPGQYTLAPEVIVPDGVEKYLMDVDSLRILVTQAADTHSM